MLWDESKGAEQYPGMGGVQTTAVNQGARSGVMKRSKVKLTPKHQHFVDEYFILQNASKAAISAGYSRKTARSQGQRLCSRS